MICKLVKGGNYSNQISTHSTVYKLILYLLHEP
nr:MAG TPA: hypothetical protein [Myoviridae sp. ctNqw6]